MSSIYALKPEDELLLSCSRTNINKETKERIQNLVQNNLDWEYIIQTASRHHLQSLLYWQLNATCPEDVPNIYLEDLRKKYKENTQKNLLFLGELLNVIKLFQKNDLKVTPYKGPLLATLAYKNLTLREFGDLDIYIQLKDFHNIRRIIQGQGYESVLNLNDSQEVAYFKFQREYRFFNKFNGVLLEIKWKLQTPSLSLNTDPKFLFNHEELITVKTGTLKIDILSPDALILVLSIHNACHLWIRLSWLCDISELIKNHTLNWEKILKNSEKMGINRILLINLYLVNDLFDVNIPPEISNLMKSDRVVPEIVKKIKYQYFMEHKLTYGENAWSLKFYEMIRLRIKIREKRKNKYKDFLSLFLAPTQNVIKKNSFPLFMFPLYYMFRLQEVLHKYLISPIKNS